MKLRVLGPLEVRSESGDLVTIPQARQRAILSVLLLNSGQPVTAGRLATAVWGPDPPAGSRVTLRSHISAIRRLLAPATRLETQAAGYLFDVSECELDLRMFQELAEQGRRSVGRGYFAKGAGLLKMALDQWREPSLADVPETPEMTGWVAQLRDQHSSVRDEWLDVSLALGRHHDLVGRLRRLVAANPTHEHTWAQLMLALYRCGRQADALAAYAEARRLLAEECGIDPGPELRGLQGRILAAEASLGLAGSIDESCCLPRRHDMAESVQRPALWPSPYQLPPDLRDFVGRDHEVAQLVRLFAESAGSELPVAVISGLAGTGKSVLALRVAHAIRHHFPDGQLYIGLTGSSGSPRPTAEVLGELLRACGAPPAGAPSRVPEMSALLRSLLADRRVLMVMDDAPCRAQIEPLLPGTAGCGVLITSRAHLAHLAGAYSLPLDAMTQEEAVRIMSQMLGTQRIANERGAADTIVEACGQLPLAVRAIGARLAVRPALPLAGLAQTLLDQHQRLDQLETGDISVRASLELSYSKLDERCRRAFRSLALIGASEFTEWMVAALLGEDQPSDVIDVLIENCLVKPVPTGAGIQARFRMHRLLCDYARERLRQVPVAERERAFERVLQAWLALGDCVAGEFRLPSPADPEDTIILAPRIAAHLLESPGDWLATQPRTLIAAARRAAELGRADAPLLPGV